ncbi:MAG: mechanosensitive ion channel [Ignavibacteriales bacterium]|nr:mechanosensitive ion channel [Ignavibacteriales bacterium]MCB9219573.1 mechanosensitive ion channel [Ignavibacteriales bacterium]
METLKEYLSEFPILFVSLQIIGVLVLAFVVYLIFKKILVSGIQRIVKKTKTDVDDILINESILKRIAYIAPILVISQFLYLVPQVENLFRKFTESAILLIFLLIIGSFINAANELYEKSKQYERRPIKGYLQIAKIIIYILGGIAIIGLLTGQQPWAVLTGVGAFTAILILIFKDTILSFVASIHISAYDLVRVGDWIEVPQFNVDGDVLDVALHTIKVQNFDKTIVVFPTHKLLEGAFKNWRGMQKAGGRRIKRSIFIDLSSVKFCDKNLLDKFRKIQLLKDYIDRKEEEIQKYNESKNVDTSVFVNGRRLTNIGTFREYLKAYLKSREDINKGFTFLVRQLTPGPSGIPIEIYVFANTTEWVRYEEIQADVFDHIFAVITEFELNIFQNPTGKDFRALGEKPD